VQRCSISSLDRMRQMICKMSIKGCALQVRVRDTQETLAQLEAEMQRMRLARVSSSAAWWQKGRVAVRSQGGV
jgi:hypothetical protein